MIRAAVKRDMAAVRNLVKELAVFEREPEAVTATLQDYERWFDEGVFECLVAEKEGTIVGIALYYTAFSTWKGKMMYLDDLIVTESYRGYGIGKALMNAFLAKAREEKAVLAKWQVLDWNTDAIEFYEKMGAEIETGWLNVKKFI